MTQIKGADKTISSILGKQSVNESVRYRFLYFCLITEVENGLLIYNNLTKELLLISEKEYNILIENNFSVDGEMVIELIEKWFLVPQEHDDVALSDKLIKIGRLIKNKSVVTDYNILTTTACNARCFYCYEAGTKAITMTEKTANDVAEYIIKKSKGKEVHITWFGGEPLCNLKAIDIICDRLTEKNVSFYSQMVSNAYLFDDELCEKAVNKWKLKWIQITLDGLADTYNRVKNYVYNDSDAFVRVTDNIERICKKNIAVQVRLNMDKHNAAELNDLVTYLNERFNKYKLFTLYPQLIYEDVGYEKISRTEEESAALIEQFYELRDRIKLLNSNWNIIKRDKFKCYSCQADDPSWLMILPDGNLGFCEHYIDSEFFGTIYDDTPKPAVWCEYCKPIQKCHTCPAYPTCLILEKCPAGMHKCSDFDEDIRVDYIRKGVLSTYKKYKSDLMNRNE